ncbi:MULTISPECIES: hypothetical protein [Haloarcula]|uniref:Uncharacterized protein n=1 Tax=Haloarcula pellucida TaxID=1427151 RepID=A0A830GLY2_9EURY|nr:MULTISPECIES: hypothetical protein [Halomicroarcula]MBX0348626.1 hypothetical protein [Halomicroarcula pellucida]MDS0278429.1 hypothetical protein [Halomicroarcula sp. S1AR25-4]GGN92525.1 hypothetical protein GCM10009030_16840 [Halomicroarcula pellucida]
MRRPLAIATLLLSVALVAVGGAAVAGVGPFQTPPDVRITDDHPSEPVLQPFEYDGRSAQPIDYVHVGTPSDGRPKPVGFVVVNAGPAREVPMSVGHSPTETNIVDRTVTMPENTTVVFLFHEAATYRVTVQTERGVGEYVVEPSDFDCNERSYGVRVEAGGQTLLTQKATTMACG